MLSELGEHESFNEYMTLFVGLFAALNVFGAVPVFARLTQSYSAGERRRAAAFTALFVFCILGAFALLGDELLRFFGISLPAFRIAGGIVIFLTGLQYLGFMTSPFASLDRDTPSVASLALVPLAIPLLAGPGAISTAVIYAHAHETLAHHLAFFVIILVVSLVVWLAMWLSALFGDRISPGAHQAISRILGIILCAVGAQFLIGGVGGVAPG